MFTHRFFSHHSYGSSYYAFVPESLDNEVVIYDAKARRTVLHVNLDGCCPNLELTSMIVSHSNVYIGLTNGRILALEKDPSTSTYSTRLLTEKHGWRAEDISVVILGIGEGSLCVATESRKEYSGTEWKLITICDRGIPYMFKLTGLVECHKFDPRRNRLLCVVRAGEDRRLHIFSLVRGSKKTLSGRSESYEIALSSHNGEAWRTSAVSTNGHVALSNHGRLLVVDPRHPQAARPSPLFERKAHHGGQSCFGGKKDEFLVYCHYRSSEIAIARLSECRWKEWDLICAENYNRHNRPSISIFSQPGFDGKNGIVVVRQKEGTLSRVMTFDLERSHKVSIISKHPEESDACPDLSCGKKAAETSLDFYNADQSDDDGTGPSGLRDDKLEDSSMEMDDVEDESEDDSETSSDLAFLDEEMSDPYASSMSNDYLPSAESDSESDLDQGCTSQTSSVASLSGYEASHEGDETGQAKKLVKSPCK